MCKFLNKRSPDERGATAGLGADEGPGPGVVEEVGLQVVPLGEGAAAARVVARVPVLGGVPGLPPAVRTLGRSHFYTCSYDPSLNRQPQVVIKGRQTNIK